MALAFISLRFYTLMHSVTHTIHALLSSLFCPWPTLQTPLSNYLHGSSPSRHFRPSLQAGRLIRHGSQSTILLAIYVHDPAILWQDARVSASTTIERLDFTNPSSLPELRIERPEGLLPRAFLGHDRGTIAKGKATGFRRGACK